MKPPANPVSALRVCSRILTIRSQRVMIDADLAEIHGVPTWALNQAVKRNAARFPEDFMFRLSPGARQEVVTNCDRLARLKFSEVPPFAFTEHGAIQAATPLEPPKRPIEFVTPERKPD